MTSLAGMSVRAARNASHPLGESVESMAITASQVDAHVGRRMRQRREALGVSQGRLGRHLGLTFSQVQKYENGTNRIGAGRLHLLAVLLGVSVLYFFEGLEDNSTTRGGSGQPAVAAAEAAVLSDAFQSIADRDTRLALLSLVCSLADPESPVGVPRMVTPRHAAARRQAIKP